MAKKRRKQQREKEEKEYKPPEFDKKEFMETEVNVAKGTILAAILAIPMGLGAYFLMPYIGAGGGLLVGLAGIGVMYFMFVLVRLDTTSYKVTSWLGPISSYFFLFLAIWVLLCNPPFSDQAAPDIMEVRVNWDGTDNYTKVVASEFAGNIVAIPSTANLTLTIRANITDNMALVVNSVEIKTTGQGEYQTMVQDPANAHIFEFILDNVHTGTQLTIQASDVSGHRGEYVFDLVAATT